MSALWVRPELSQGHFTLFLGLLAVSVAGQLMISPRRRRAMGVRRFVLATGLLAAIPLAGMLIVRTAFFDAFQDANYGWWSALWLSLLWMAVFMAGARAAVRRLPPTSWLVADLRLAADSEWRAFLTQSTRTRRA
jgi:hypothetical protein